MNTHCCGFFSQHDWELSEAQSPSPAALRTALHDCFLQLIAESAVTHFIVSVERGAPLEALSLLLALRETKAIQVDCLIPFEEQHIDWPEELRDRYFSLIARCDQELLLQTSFSLVCYRESARRLLSDCDTIVLLWNGRPSDAADAARLAVQKRRRVIQIDPHLLGKAEL